VQVDAIDGPGSGTRDGPPASADRRRVDGFRGTGPPRDPPAITRALEGMRTAQFDRQQGAACARSRYGSDAVIDECEQALPFLR
jgi:hypothetical protein